MTADPRPRTHRVPRRVPRRSRPRDRGGSAGSRLLRLEPPRQLRVGLRLLQAVRDRLRRLPDARAGAEGQLLLVPRPHCPLPRDPRPVPRDTGRGRVIRVSRWNADCPAPIAAGAGQSASLNASSIRHCRLSTLGSSRSSTAAVSHDPTGSSLVRRTVAPRAMIATRPATRQNDAVNENAAATPPITPGAARPLAYATPATPAMLRPG